MTTHHGKHGEGRTWNPPRLASSAWFGGKVVNYREVLNLKGQKAPDDFYLFDVPQPLAFKRGTIISDTPLGSVFFSIGVKANHGMYRAAREHTGEQNAPTDFGPAQTGAFDKLERDTTVYLYIEGGEMPRSGSLIVDMEFVGV